jgi:hypothetical protein
MSTILNLRNDELSQIIGGGGVPSKLADLAGDVSKALGRKGKPFLGRDFVAVAVGVGVGIATQNPVQGLEAGKAIDLAYDLDRGTGLAGGAPSPERPGEPH